MPWPVFGGACFFAIWFSFCWCLFRKIYGEVRPDGPTSLLSPLGWRLDSVYCSPQNLMIRFLLPPPTPEFLSKDFCLQPCLEWKFLLRRSRSGQKLLPSLSLPHKGKAGVLSKNSLVPPRIRWKISRHWVGGRIGILKIQFSCSFGNVLLCWLWCCFS